MAGQYVRAFSERVADVPSYLRRHLALIRDLDEKVQALQKEIELHTKRKLVAGEGGGGGGKRQRLSESGAYDVDSAVTRLLSLADEKVNIAAQVYDFIDKHIQHLDEDLKALGQEIELEKGTNPAAILEGAEAAAHLPEVPAIAGPATTSKAKTSKAKGSTAKTSKKSGGKAGAAAAAAGAPAAAALAAPVLGAAPFYLTSAPGEHEPLYCYCQRPSHGQMVACDNDECPYEWFHYECVGMTEPPAKDQEWFCPDCAPKVTARRAAHAAAAAAGQTGKS